MENNIYEEKCEIRKRFKDNFLISVPFKIGL